MASFYKEKKGSETRHVAFVRMQGISVKRRFQSHGEAKIWARSTEAAIEEGRYDIVRRKPMEAGKKTLQNIVDMYLADINFDKQPKTSQDYEDGIKVQRAAELLRGPIEQISSGHIYEVFSKLTNTRSGKPLAPSSIGKYFDSCIKMMDVAIPLGWFTEWDDNRFRVAKQVALRQGAVKPPAERVREGEDFVPRVRLLSAYVYAGSHPDYAGKTFHDVLETDMIKLEAEVDARHRYLIDVIDFALYSSMRMGHIWRLEWKHVDLSDPEMVIVMRRRKQKNADQRRESSNWEEAPLSPEASALLVKKAKEEGTEGFVFKGRPEDDQTVGDHFIELSKRLGFYESGLTFHVLRHEACSRFHEQDYPKDFIKAMTGHRMDSSLERYTHLRPSTKINKWKAMRDR